MQLMANFAQRRTEKIVKLPLKVKKRVDSLLEHYKTPEFSLEKGVEENDQLLQEEKVLLDQVIEQIQSVENEGSNEIKDEIEGLCGQLEDLNEDNISNIKE